MENAFDRIKSKASDDTKTYYKDAIIDTFCHSNDDQLSIPLELLVQIFPYIKSGQQSGIIDKISLRVTESSSLLLWNFCLKFFENIQNSNGKEVRVSYINLLDKLSKIIEYKIQGFAMELFESNELVNRHYVFIGKIVGKFLVNGENLNSFISNLNSEKHHLRVISQEALMDANYELHDKIISNIISLDHQDISKNSIKAIFGVVSNLSGVSKEKLLVFLDNYPWPLDVNKELEKNFINLIEKDKGVFEWMCKMISSGNDKSSQFLCSIIGIIEKNVYLFKIDQLEYLFNKSKDQHLLRFSIVAGNIVGADYNLAVKIFDCLINSENRNIQTHAIQSLSHCINNFLQFVLMQGETIIELSKKEKTGNYGLLHVFLFLLKGYSGNSYQDILFFIESKFDHRFLSLIGNDEKSITELLIILKIYAKKDYLLILEISKRISITTQGVAGAMAALYSNLITCINDKSELFYMLDQLLSIAKYKQKNIRNSLKRGLCILSEKLGKEEVFEVFFHKYHLIENSAALEDLIKAIICVPGWSEEQTNRLLKDKNIPSQIQSILYSRTYGR